MLVGAAASGGPTAPPAPPPPPLPPHSAAPVAVIPARQRSLSTPQRLLRKSLRNSLSGTEWEKIRSPVLFPSTTDSVVVVSGSAAREEVGVGETGSSAASGEAGREATPSNTDPEIHTTITMADVGIEVAPVVLNGKLNGSNGSLNGLRSKRNSLEPVKKKQKRLSDTYIISAEDEQQDIAEEDEDADDPTQIPLPVSPVAAAPAKRGAIPRRTASLSPAITRSIRGRKSTTPAVRTTRSQRGRTPMVKKEYSPAVEQLSVAVSEAVAAVVDGAAEKGEVAEREMVVEQEVQERHHGEGIVVKATEETMIQVDENMDYTEEDILDFSPEMQTQQVPPNPRPATASSRRSKKVDPTMALNKVKTGRISKFKEGSMNDRVSTRPPAHLIGYALNSNNSKQVETPTPLSADSRTSTDKTPIIRPLPWRKPKHYRRRYTGDEVFTFGGFLSSVFQFKGLEYVRENWWGPTKQRILDKMQLEAEKAQQERELEAVKKKAEELYKMRKNKEWREMEARREKEVEELRRKKMLVKLRKERREQAGESMNGVKRKFADITSEGGGGEEEEDMEEGEEEEGEEEEVDLEPAELSETEIAKVEDLVLSLTGYNIVQHPSITSPARSQTSQQSFSAFVNGHDNIHRNLQAVHGDEDPDHQHQQLSDPGDESDYAGCTPPSFVCRNSNNGKPTNGGHKKSKSTSSLGALQALKQRASKIFSGVIGGSSISGGNRSNSSSKGTIASTTTTTINRMSTSSAPITSNPTTTINDITNAVRNGTLPPINYSNPPTPSKKFTKRELMKQERLRRRVSELEAKLYDTWRELEAAGGLVNMKVTPASSEYGGSFNAGSGSGASGVEREGLGRPGSSSGVVNGHPIAAHEQEKGKMGPPPVPVGKR